MVLCKWYKVVPRVSYYSAATRSQIRPKSHDFSRIRDANSRKLRGICANSGIFPEEPSLTQILEIRIRTNRIYTNFVKFCSKDNSFKEKRSRIAVIRVNQKKFLNLREFGRFRANL
jgi:hypothetical protein